MNSSMTSLKYDPAQGETFWSAVRQLPGFPAGDEIPLKTMLIESNAIYRTPEVLREVLSSGELQVLLVMDPSPMRREASDLKSLVAEIIASAGWRIEKLVLQPDSSGQVHTDLHQIGVVKDRIRPGLVVLSVGSGTVTDITKHACHLYEQEQGSHVPFVVFQTANSVSAYTSSMAPTFIDGVKRTLDSRYPDALICDLETLRDAPRPMTVAGVGDMLAIFVSFPDWTLAHRLGMDDHYTPLPQELIGPLDEILLAYAGEIAAPTLKGMQVLAKLISLGGLAMSLSHATTPLSGYEHVMSHILDLILESKDVPLNMHGSQIALTTLLASEAYRIFFDEFDPGGVELEQFIPEPEAAYRQIATNFLEVDPSGKAGKECWHDYQIKLDRWYQNRENVRAALAEWPALRTEAAALARPAEKIAQILKAIDAPLGFAELMTPFTVDEIRFAFLNSPLMRKRLTLGDLLIFFGIDRQRVWERAWRKLEASS